MSQDGKTAAQVNVEEKQVESDVKTAVETKAETNVEYKVSTSTTEGSQGDNANPAEIEEGDVKTAVETEKAVVQTEKTENSAKPENPDAVTAMETENGNEEIPVEDLEIQDETKSEMGEEAGDNAPEKDVVTDKTQVQDDSQDDESLEAILAEERQGKGKRIPEFGATASAYRKVKIARIPRKIFDFMANIEGEGDSVRFNLTQFRMYLNAELWQLAKYVDAGDWKSVDHPLLELDLPKNASEEVLVHTCIPSQLAAEEFRITKENELLEKLELPGGFEEMTANQRKKAITKARKTANNQAAKFRKKARAAAPNPFTTGILTAPAPAAPSVPENSGPAKCSEKAAGPSGSGQGAVPSSILPAKILPAKPATAAKTAVNATKNAQNARKRPHDEPVIGNKKPAGPSGNKNPNKPDTKIAERNFPKKNAGPAGGKPGNSKMNNNNKQKGPSNKNDRRFPNGPAPMRGAGRQQMNQNVRGRPDWSSGGPSGKRMRRDSRTEQMRGQNNGNEWSRGYGMQMQQQSGQMHPVFNNQPTVNWGSNPSPWASNGPAMQSHSGDRGLDSMMRRSAFEPTPVPPPQADLGSGLSGILLNKLASVVGSGQTGSSGGRTTFDQFTRSSSPPRVNNGMGFNEKRTDFNMDRYVEPLESNFGSGGGAFHNSSMGMGNSMNSSYDNRMGGNQMSSMGSGMGGANYGNSMAIGGGGYGSGSMGSGIMNQSDTYGAFINQLERSQNRDGFRSGGSRNNGYSSSGRNDRRSGGGRQERGRRDRR